MSEEPLKVLPFIEHLVELRRRLIIIVVAVVIGMNVDRVLDHARIDLPRRHQGGGRPADCGSGVVDGDKPGVRNLAGVELRPGRRRGLERGFPGLDADGEDRLDLRPVRRLHRPDRRHEQHEPPPELKSVEQTPVAGRVSWTSVAAGMSPSSQAVMERTCS